MVKDSNGLTIAWSIQTPVMLRDESNSLCSAMAAVHDQPSNIICSQTKGINIQKKSKLTCDSSGICFVVCICVVFLLFFPGTASALMRTFTRQPYSLHASRKRKRKTMKIKRTTCENRADKNMKKQHATNTHTYMLLLFCLLYYLACFAVKHYLAPCIYGWRAERKNSSYVSWGVAGVAGAPLSSFIPRS